MSVNPSEILLYAAIAGLVFYKVIYAQLKGTMLSLRGLAATPLILLAVGAYFTVKVLPEASGAEIGLLLADLGVLLVLGALRSLTTKLSTRDGYAFQKGTSLTLIMWVATMAIRVGFVVFGSAIGATGPLTSASITLTLGASIGLQNLLTYQRVQRLGLRLAADGRELAATTR